MKRKLFAITMAAVLLLAGCGGGGTAANGAAGGTPSSSAPSGGNYLPDYENGWSMDSAEAAPGEPMPEPDVPESGAQTSSVYQNPRAKLIRRAELSIQTEQFDESREALNTLVASCEGYFENSSEYGGSRRDVNASRRGSTLSECRRRSTTSFCLRPGSWAM